LRITKISEGKPRKCVQHNKGAHNLKVLKSMEEANKRNEGRKFYTIAHRVKASFWFVMKDNLIGNDQLIVERWKQYLVKKV
jgi:hypothetical protein